MGSPGQLGPLSRSPGPLCSGSKGLADETGTFSLARGSAKGRRCFVNPRDRQGSNKKPRVVRLRG